MKGVSLVRIDDRLIHGQIVSSWINFLGADRIIVADNKAANDSFQKSLLKMAVPKSVAMDIVSVEEAAKMIQGFSEKDKVLVILRNGASLLEIAGFGIVFESVNVGNSSMNPKRKQYFKSVWLTEEEVEEYRKLKDLGTYLDVRVVPDEKGIELFSLIKS